MFSSLLLVNENEKSGFIFFWNILVCSILFFIAKLVYVVYNQFSSSCYMPLVDSDMLWLVLIRCFFFFCCWCNLGSCFFVLFLRTFRPIRYAVLLVILLFVNLHKYFKDILSFKVAYKLCWSWTCRCWVSLPY